MFIGDFKSPDGLLVANRVQWTSTPILTGFPSDDGDADISVIQSTIASALWETPMFEGSNSLDEPGQNWRVFGLYPSAKPIWHDALHSIPFVLFRAPAASLLPSQDSCDVKLADALAEVASLTAQVASLTSQNVRLEAELNQTNAALSEGLASVESNFRLVFKNPLFVIPGSTPGTRFQNLTDAILGLTKGEKNPIYQALFSRR